MHMRRFLASAAMALVAFAGTAAMAVPASATPVTGGSVLSAVPGIDAVIIADGVRLRSTPGGSKVIGYLYYGDYGQVGTSSTNGWCYFRLGGRSASGLPAGTAGWVSCSYLAREDGLGYDGPAVDTLAG
ncbi:hypothetical protein ACIBCT_07270 [Streptosporangium sp. NPDC050855]|uniref:hypothetical protein n=1 Tax=Streptosporangium sp. NPDC050855 TaxID=3366194 RepID=UPI0037A8B94A